MPNNLLLISSSLTGAHPGHRGREYVGIPNYSLPKNGTWAISLLIKEAPGYHTSESYFTGADLDTTEAAPFDSVYHPRFGFNGADKLLVREKTGNHWIATDATTNRSESKHIVFNWDGTDLTNSTMEFYENGLLVGTSSKDISGHADSGSFNLEAIGSGYNNGTAAGTPVTILQAQNPT